MNGLIFFTKRIYTKMIDHYGFTIAEVLVVIAIIAIIGTIMVTTFSNTLRGSNKAQIISAIKQNGQSALENMDKNIRNADNLVCNSSSPSCSGLGDTVVVVQNGTYTRYRIALSSAVSGMAPASCIGTGANGCIIWDNPAKQIDANTNNLETDPVFIQRICGSTIINGIGAGIDPMPLANILTDTNQQTGVSVIGGSFNCSNLAGFKTNVTLNFQLGPGSQAPAATSGQIDPVTFQTTVSLR
ncbi:prepilin-type N-terminal cleavage/methylation domain-containing protein [Patescibacteria group bacterium]|nr:prepilin-type N-terminal cleavage/methylation domain-containing protein [Patescibacteria group bacterium]